ncbi:MAG: glycosyltransferase [Bacteroidales bacterium]|nr:glycosyltransferase [Bacteroidales bacterium]
MITGKDFVFTGLQPWDLQIGSNAKDIALEISKHNRVLYINTPLDKKTYHGQQQSPEITQRRKVVQKQIPVIRQINPNLWILDYPFSIWSTNFLPDGFLFDIANKINQKKMYSFVKKILNQLQFNEYILFIDNDIYRSFYTKEYLSPKLTIYYRRDNMVSSFWEKHAFRLEPKLCYKVNLVLTNSQNLANNVQKYNKHTYNVGQGVDLSNYDINTNYEIPKDIQNIPHPIIGYTGMLTSLRLDINLIYKLAQNLNTYSFVLIGKEDNSFKTHPIHQLNNIYFLGNKDSQLIPNYISAFDICINPQAINPITIGNYPRKIDEYLALGKPVVATKTDFMNEFENYTKNCSCMAEYKDAIISELKTDNAQKRKERIIFANNHSWENSVYKIYKHISLFTK